KTPGEERHVPSSPGDEEKTGTCNEQREKGPLSPLLNSVRRRDEARFGHQLPMQGLILFEKLHHGGTREEDRLQRLLLHVVLELRRLGDALEQLDVERRLLSRYLAGQEQAAQHG